MSTIKNKLGSEVTGEANPWNTVRLHKILLSILKDIICCTEADTESLTVKGTWKKRCLILQWALHPLIAQHQQVLVSDMISACKVRTISTQNQHMMLPLLNSNMQKKLQNYRLFNQKKIKSLTSIHSGYMIWWPKSLLPIHSGYTITYIPQEMFYC